MGLLKIPGLASGLDTDNLIKTLMTLERRPVVSLEQRSSKLTTEANAWRDLNQRLLTLQKRLEEIKNLDVASWDGKKATVGDSSQLTVTADATAATGTYTVEVVKLAKATILQSGQMGSGPVADANQDLNLSGTVQIAGTTKTFTVSATDSLNDIAASINAQKETLGLSAAVIQVNPGDYRLVITGEVGAAADFALEDASGSTVAADLKLTVAAGATKVDTAANGELKVNGITINTSSNKVKDAIAGTTITMAKAGSSTTVTVSEDNSKITGAVKAFVDQYNSIMDFIGQLTSYNPETKQAGTLLGVDRIRTIKDTLQVKFLEPVSTVADKFESFSMVGITTEKPVSGQKYLGKLAFDQTKFEKVLDENPSAVRELFTLDNGADKGIAVRGLEWLDNYTKSGGILGGQVDMLNKEAERIKDRIKVWDELILPKREDRLRNQYNNLEKAMSRMQNQGNWLSAQLKSLMSSGNDK